MQKDPEKQVRNFNEHHGPRPNIDPQRGSINLEAGHEQVPGTAERIVRAGIEVVNAKVNEILGDGNKLTRVDLPFPSVRFVRTVEEHPNWSGYFSSANNEIVVITGKTAGTLSQTKVFIHEYVHYLSHNGRNANEQLDKSTPLTEENNVGFKRFWGLDIRAGREGKVTTDYFLSFNEAVTEQLAIDILPGVHETYADYRGLLSQVIEDAVTRGMGSKGADGVFESWSEDHFKTYIYKLFFKGDLAGFTTLLKKIYKEFELSEQQFGLMTCKEDLPSVILRTDITPGGPKPSPGDVPSMVQARLNAKTAEDYITDIISPDPDNGDGGPGAKYEAEYDAFINENNIAFSHSILIGDTEWGVDTLGYMVYQRPIASEVLDTIKEELDDMLSLNIDASAITERMDELLFGIHRMSMLSDGFREFYVYKHEKIDKAS